PLARLPLSVLPADLPRPRRSGTAWLPHRPAGPLVDLLQPGSPGHLPGQDPGPAPRLLRLDPQPGRLPWPPALGPSTVRRSGRGTPRIAPSIPRGPGGRNRLADQRPDGLGLVLSRPRLALFLIDRHRGREVLVRVLGESLAGTLFSDFYTAYNGLDC